MPYSVNLLEGLLSDNIIALLLFPDLALLIVFKPVGVDNPSAKDGTPAFNLPDTIRLLTVGIALLAGAFPALEFPAF